MQIARLEKSERNEHEEEEEEQRKYCKLRVHCKSVKINEKGGRNLLATAAACRLYARRDQNWNFDDFKSHSHALSMSFRLIQLHSLLKPF